MSERALEPGETNEYVGDIGEIAVENLGTKIDVEEAPEQVREAAEDLHREYKRYQKQLLEEAEQGEGIEVEHITADGKVVNLDKKAEGEGGAQSYYEVEVDGKKEKVSPGDVAMNRDKYKDKKFTPHSMQELI
jgi:hypothetical protein